MLDVLRLSEHWTVEEQIKLINLNQYRLKSYFCRSKIRGGGSGIFVREILSARQVHYLNGITQEKTSELVAVELLDIKVVIVCIYRSLESDIDEFLGKLEIMIRRTQEHKKRLIICGDWNVNFCHNNSKLIKVLNIMERHNLINRILTPTRLTKTSSSLLDVIITEGSNCDIKIANIDLGFSDHKVQIFYQRLEEPVMKVIHKKKKVFY
jgi:exonuclease III